MNEKIKILIGILVFIVIIIFIIIIIGDKWWFLQRKIVVNVDKTEYKIEETVKISIETDPRRSIYRFKISGYPYLINSHCWIAEKDKGEWKFVRKESTYTPSDIDREGRYIEFLPGKTYINEIKFHKKGIYKVVCDGYTYRHYCLLSLISPGSCFITNPFYKTFSFYSPEFVIKEAEGVAEDETANWQTYRNEEYGFEIKYPEDWEFLETTYPKEMKLYVFSVGFIPESEVYWVEGTPGVSPIKIFVNKSFPEYIDKEKEEQILVNGKPTIKREGYLGLEYEVAFLQPNSLGYYLEIVNSIQDVKAAGNISEDEATQFNKIFNQMLSTFRFLE